MDNEKHSWGKYFGIALAVLVGAFLAFYFVADLTVKAMMSPEYQMRKMERIMKHEGRDMNKISHFVHIKKNEDVYKIIVDLKPFDNDVKNVVVRVIGDDELLVEGAVEKQKLGADKLMKFSETYLLDDEVIADKMIKEKMHNKVVYTLPIKE